MASQTSLPDQECERPEPPPAWASVRWRVALCAFAALLVAQTFRLSFTVGVTCMVDWSSGQATASKRANASDWAGLTPAANQTWNASHARGQGETRVPTTDEAGEFDWNKKTQTTLLSAYFYGYIVTQIPAGWLSRRYGTRWVIGISMMVAMACTALTPTCARTHVYLLFAVRVLLGAVQGMVYPAVFNLTVRWVPPLESTRFLTVIIAGFPIGQVLTFPISGLLCQYGFDQGWASISYVFAITSLIWMMSWFYTVYDTPLQHPRISRAEQEYIVSRVGRFESKQEKTNPTPWCSIVCSPPVWGAAMGYFGIDWVNNTFGLGLILYMREVLQYQMTSSGFLGALPFLVYFLSSMVVGCMADFILKKQALSRVNTRRLFQALSFVPMGVLLSATGFVTRENAPWAVACLILAQMFFGLSRAGFLVSVMDFAPRFAGEISGILNVIAQTTGFFVPLAIGNLTPNGTQEEWRVVFLIGGGISIGAALGFCVFARGEVQPWAKGADSFRPETEIMVEVKAPIREEKTTKDV